ncbi:MAG: S8 family peptidase [Oscillospiraceae bacterium]|jgi:hypothetical protein|nr:S8 family peptidase [Oscillospiraceae bacterium]
MDNTAGLTLDEFIAQPDAVEFTYVNTQQFQSYIKNKPYIRIGTVLKESDYAVAYTTRPYIEGVLKDLGSDFVGVFPQPLVPLGSEANAAAGITAVWQQPFLSLRGSGVLLGFVDTGIDYTKQTFQYENKTSKIKYIWDQTINGNPPETIRFGSVYTQDDINKALASADPYSVVPTRDEHGHGTFLASAAGGRDSGEYSGAAPDAEIIAVRLKPANPYLTETFNAKDIEAIYSSADFMLGINFIIDRAGELNRPVVLCIGMGSNFGSHSGDTFLEDYLSIITRRVGIIAVAAAGNESNRKHHTDGKIAKTGDKVELNINIGGNTDTTWLYIWNDSFDKISVEVISPIGETTSRVPVRFDDVYGSRLKMSSSVISIRYHTNAHNVAMISITKPTPGIWNVLLYGDSIVDGTYHAWMPISSGASVEFLNPTPNTTIVIPATSPGVICCGGYSSFDNSLYISSSWGPNRENRMKPDFVAPGVNVRGFYPTGPGEMTGTSASAAVTAGACALLLQWALINGNEHALDQGRMRALLINGCVREDSISYPNTQWGYGKLNLFEVFNFLKEN